MLTRMASRLNTWCDSLSSRQRIRLILILSGVYLLMTVVVLVWTYTDHKNEVSIEIRHIYPVPMLRKVILPAPMPMPVLLPDSTSTPLNEKSYGKE
jgi:hypothetical protein